MESLKIQQLIDVLQEDVQHTLTQTNHLRNMTADELLQQPGAGQWSIAQVVEHLNGYNRFYLTEIDRAMQGNKLNLVAAYKPGWLGNYFTRIMQPREDGTLVKKMSAPTEYNYGPDLDVDKVLNEFKEGQEQLLRLLEQARKANLGKIKIPISLSRFVKLKLGDTFRFLVAHQMRHFLQIKKAQNMVTKNKAA